MSSYHCLFKDLLFRANGDSQRKRQHQYIADIKGS